MSNVMDAVDQARSETQSLYKQLREDTAKTHAAIRTDLQDATAQAQRLASSLQKVASDRRTDEKKHLEHAASLLEQIAAGAKGVASASAEEIRKANMAMLGRTRDALEDISHAIAVRRAGAQKQPAQD